MSTMQDRMKIAQPAGGGVPGAIACRSTTNNPKTKSVATASPVRQHKISAFEDSAGEVLAVALEKNVLSRCHHSAATADEGSHKNMACSGSQNNNFLHDNDFTFIDADDDLQSTEDAEGGGADPSLEIVAGDNGCDATDNAGYTASDIGGSGLLRRGDCDSAVAKGKQKYFWLLMILL